MSFSTQQQSELKIQKGIRQAEDEIVRWIQAALDETDYEKPEKEGKKSRDQLEESQFRNLVRVADTTESPEVVKNFLRYQVGRDKKWGRGPGSLAERIIVDIDGNLQQKAKAIAKAANSKDTNKIWMDLIQRYLGYGSRYLTYLNKGVKTGVKPANQTAE